MSEKGVLLISGGIDSVTLAYKLKREKRLGDLFFVDYGQKSANLQWGLVEYHAKALGVHAHRDLAPFPAYAQGNGSIFGRRVPHVGSLTHAYGALEMSEAEYKKYLEDEWDFIQGRNIIFLTRAAMYATNQHVSRVYVAFQFDRPEWAAGIGTGCDTSPLFVDAWNHLASSGGFQRPVRVVAPFLDAQLDKRNIVRLGRLYGANLEKTHSCEFVPACGRCRQCLVRAEVLAKSTKAG